MTEFELIRTYFAAQALARADVRVGIGDDAALVRMPSGTEAAVTTDILVAGVHFFDDADPAAVGHKSLAVNLSDLAAMGAEPAWFLLDLTLPDANAAWLRRFTEGLFGVARRYNVQLIGGDTSRGPLSIAITAIGLVPEGKGLLRTGARPGDVVYVTGTLGDARLALAGLRGERDLGADELAAVRARLERPWPRVAEGTALRDLASSAIDISDGLVADLGHILEASGAGACIALDTLPLSATYRARLREIGWDYALAGGDDYELCVTVPRARQGAVEALIREAKLPLTAIGEITAGHALVIQDAGGGVYHPKGKGHDHFASA